MTSTRNLAACAALALLPLLLAAAPAAAHGDAAHAKPTSTGISSERHAFGRQGDPRDVRRTIRIAMSDGMRFSPAAITVRQGETVRLVVTNKGRLQHELVIGTMDQLRAHGELMKKHPEMEHDEPYMAHVSPGKSEELVWRFSEAGEFHYGCLVPGHFDAGMIGRITVKKGTP